MTALTANCIDLNIQGNSVYAILRVEFYSSILKSVLHS